MFKKDLERRGIVVYSTKHALEANGYQRFEKLMEMQVCFLAYLKIEIRQGIMYSFFLNLKKPVAVPFGWHVSLVASRTKVILQK